MLNITREIIMTAESGLRGMSKAEYRLLKYGVIFGVSVITSGLTSVTLDGVRNGSSLVL